MLPFTWSLLRRRGIRNLLLLFGVLVVSGAFGLLVSTAEANASVVVGLVSVVPDRGIRGLRS